MKIFLVSFLFLAAFLTHNSNQSFAFSNFYSESDFDAFTSPTISSNQLKQLLLRIGRHQTRILSYSGARKALYSKVYLKFENNKAYVEDIYCNKKIYLKKKSNNSYSNPNHTIMNCEHSWPQSKFNSSMKKGDQKADLHHLFPSDSNANSKRGNAPFGETVHSHQVSNNCHSSYTGYADSDILKDYQSKNSRSSHYYFEPPNDVKGDIARALFYFSTRYKLKIDQVQESFLRYWNEIDPVSAEEIERNDKIESIQGNRNPFVDYPELASRILDF